MKLLTIILTILLLSGCNNRIEKKNTQQSNELSPPAAPNITNLERQNEAVYQDINDKLDRLLQREAPSTTETNKNPAPEKIQSLPRKPADLPAPQKKITVTQSATPPTAPKTEPAPRENFTETRPTFTWEMLPITFGEWTLDRKQDTLSQTARCLLTSRDQKFNDGYSEAKIQIRLSNKSLFIKTNSNIDLSYPDVGLYIDGTLTESFKTQSGESSIELKSRISALIKKMASGKQLTVKLGFWPTWPKTETRNLTFSLTDFDEASHALTACDKL